MTATSAPGPARRTAAPDVRLVRASAFATVSVALAAGAHGAAGGAAVGLGPVALGWLLVCAVAAAAAGRRRSMPGITAGVLAGQLGLHLLFRTGHAMAAPPSVRTSMPGMTGMSGMSGSAGRPGGRAGQSPVPPSGHLHHAVAAAHGGVLGLSPGMLAGHAAAALATGWLLHRVEAALWHLLDLARTVRAAARRWSARIRRALALLTRTPAPPAAPRHPARPRHDATAGHGRSALLRHSLIRRGPPGAVRA
ncbi:hypothetical protein AB0K43_10840 [Kitasatospora sp. NPDC049258]|uniref:hypothetical protein n=1 Tax=Kitasatospora sp. NPDC049258 TaxID=3155394 RepID=UPI00341F65D4